MTGLNVDRKCHGQATTSPESCAGLFSSASGPQYPSSWPYSSLLKISMLLLLPAFPFSRPFIKPPATVVMRALSSPYGFYSTSSAS